MLDFSLECFLVVRKTVIKTSTKRIKNKGGRGKTLTKRIGDTKQSPSEKGSTHSSEDASGFLNLAPLQGSGYTTEGRG